MEFKNEDNNFDLTECFEKINISDSLKEKEIIKTICEYALAPLEETTVSQFNKTKKFENYKDTVNCFEKWFNNFNKNISIEVYNNHCKIIFSNVDMSHVDDYFLQYFGECFTNNILSKNVFNDLDIKVIEFKNCIIG